MSVRKRKWTTRKGAEKEAWIVDYVDQGDVRRLKTFDRKKDADAFEATARVEVSEGTHVADRASVTVTEAGDMWIASAKRAGLERTTLDQYLQHLRLHIEPMLGRTLLSRLNAPTVRAFEDRLRDEGRSPTLTRYVVRSLGALLADAQERGLVVRNTVRELRGRRKRGADARRRREVETSKSASTSHPAEIKAIAEAAARPKPQSDIQAKMTAEDRRGQWPKGWRPLLLTAIFTGLRASELRGLRWSDVDLKKNVVNVRQRADKYRTIGQPKSSAAERIVPLPPTLVAVLREWKLACPKGELDLAFPTEDGTIQAHPNIIERGLKPTMIAAGVTVPVLDANGKPKRDEDGTPLVEAKYTGLHALRHFYASWCINRKADGGLELPAKVVQARMGHSSIMVTLDTYGHLFPSGDDGAELAAAETALLG